MTFSYATSSTVSVDTFWASIGVFMKYFSTFVDAGTYNYFNIIPDFMGGYSFTFDPFWGGNLTQTQLQQLVHPYLTDLAGLGISVTAVYTEYPSL